MAGNIRSVSPYPFSNCIAFLNPDDAAVHPVEGSAPSMSICAIDEELDPRSDLQHRSPKSTLSTRKATCMRERGASQVGSRARVFARLPLHPPRFRRFLWKLWRARWTTLTMAAIMNIAGLEPIEDPEYRYKMHRIIGKARLRRVPRSRRPRPRRAAAGRRFVFLRRGARPRARATAGRGPGERD